MNVCIYIIGQPRMIDFCVPLYKEIFEHLEPDYYVYHWDEVQEKYTSHINNKTTLINPEEIVAKYQRILNNNLKEIKVQPNTVINNYKEVVTKLISCLEENINKKLKPHNRSNAIRYFKHALNYISQHHCTNLCNNLRQETTNKKYDCIIRIRSDLVFRQLYKNKNNINLLTERKEKLYNYLNNFLNIPLIICDGLMFKENAIKANDCFYITNEMGINTLTNNVCSTWVINILQDILGEFTLYKTNHPQIPMDQHYSLFANLLYKQPGTENTELHYMNENIYTRLFCGNEICRKTVKSNDELQDIVRKNAEVKVAHANAFKESTNI